jgi:hypothetical protein
MPLLEILVDIADYTMVDLIKLVISFLMLPFIVMGLFVVLTAEKMSELYGPYTMPVSITVTIFVLVIGFTKDFWTGMITFLTVGIIWFGLVQRFLY